MDYAVGHAFYPAANFGNLPPGFVSDRPGYGEIST